MTFTPEERRHAFDRIKAYFDDYDATLARQGKLPLGSTDKGFWGVSHLDDVYALCERIDLASKSGLLDLGSGDGRAALVTALFTRTVGIEYDARLHGLALQALETLSRDLAYAFPVEFVHGDYVEHDLGGYDVLYTYADHNFRWLTPKLGELRAGATLYCYHDTFHPEGMVKGRIVWLGQLPVFTYTLRDAADGPDQELPRKE